MKLSGEAFEDIYRIYKDWLKKRPYDRTLVIPIIDEDSTDNQISKLIIRR